MESENLKNYIKYGAKELYKDNGKLPTVTEVSPPTYDTPNDSQEPEYTSSFERLNTFIPLTPKSPETIPSPEQNNELATAWIRINGKENNPITEPSLDKVERFTRKPFTSQITNVRGANQEQDYSYAPKEPPAISWTRKRGNENTSITEPVSDEEKPFISRPFASQITNVRGANQDQDYSYAPVQPATIALGIMPIKGNDSASSLESNTEGDSFKPIKNHVWVTGTVQSVPRYFTEDKRPKDDDLGQDMYWTREIKSKSEFNKQPYTPVVPGFANIADGSEVTRFKVPLRRRKFQGDGAVTFTKPETFEQQLEESRRNSQQELSKL